VWWKDAFRRSNGYGYCAPWTGLHGRSFFVSWGEFPAGSGTVREAEMMWKEKTGKKTGWLVKTDEEKIWKIKGLRCLECGYIEFYAK